MRVLIVDDSKLARMAVIKALKRLRPDWDYVEAGNPDEALVALSANPSRIAVIDFNMPVRDGLALAAELLELNKDISIAIVSANAQHEILERTASLGATFLSKPLNEAAFGTFLDRIAQS